MAGTMLAMISVMLLVSFHQLWKEKGLFIRAGIICALMKSISPSALLLGPMTGILTEAALMELFVLLFGGNIVGYILGGSFALASTIAHKIVTLLIMYGFDFVTVLLNLYNYAVKQIGYPDMSPKVALWFLAGIYALLGVISALGGYYLGKKALIKGGDEIELSTINYNSAHQRFSLDRDQKFSVTFLFFNIFAIAACLVLINRYSFVVALGFVTAYLMFCFFQYKNALKHLKRPFFWVQVIILTLLATLFYNGFQKGNIFDPEGLIAGLKMNVRAVLILVGFSSISVELRNPVVKSVLFDKGFSQLYLSLSMAFSALPSIISRLTKPKDILKHPLSFLAGMLLQSKQLLKDFKKMATMPKVIIITAEKHKGKTTYVKNLVELLGKKGYKTGGFLAPGKFEDNRRSEFDILDLSTGTQTLLAGVHLTEGEKIGSFVFSKKGVEFGKQILNPQSLLHCDFVVIDEIGPLEMKGMGWAASIEGLLKYPDFTQIWVVRRTLVESVIQKWGLTHVQVIDIERYTVEKTVNILAPGTKARVASS